MALLGKKFGLFGRNKASDSKTKDTRPPKIPLPCLLVRFDIGKCNAASYGSRCCKLLLDAVSPEELEATMLFYGDSAKTLAGLENVFVIAIASRNEDRLKSIRPMLLNNAAFMECCAQPPCEMKSSSTEPLILCGVVMNGLLENGESMMAVELKKRAKR